jgi:DNA-binding NarL/FixJ family response regulator
MRKILIVEDDFDFAEILMEWLGSDPEFHIAEVIRNQADAARFCETGQIHEVDAVIVDLQLPASGSDKRINPAAGLQLIEQMRLQHNFCGRIVVVTNSNSLSDGNRALRAGCDGYLCKHLRMDDLPGLMSELTMAIRDEVMMLSSEMRYVITSEIFRVDSPVVDKHA